MKRAIALLLASIIVISILPLNVFANGGPYIQYIAVTDGIGIDSPEKTLEEYGYTVMRTDLNLGTGDDDLIMGYKTTNDPGKALTSLMVIGKGNDYYQAQKKGYIYPYEGYDPDYLSDDDFSEDLNEGAGGAYIWLVGSYETKNGAPITELYLKEGTEPPDGSGWEIVKKMSSGQPADLNEDAGGAWLYLFVKHDYSATGSIFAPPSVWFIAGAGVLVAAGVVTTIVIVKKRRKVKT